MRIRLTSDRATTLGVWRDGDEIDVPEAEARALIRSGQAIAIESGTPPLESMTVAPAENAMVPHKPKPKRKGQQP
jgi:hypothetical protein